MNRNITRFGCWNVRKKSGGEEEVLDEMKRYGLEVLGVSEARMKGNGVRMVGEVTCVHSGVQAGRAKAGVAILLSEKFGTYLREWKCVDKRILWIRLKVEGT